jgi:hypothetical protein
MIRRFYCFVNRNWWQILAVLVAIIAGLTCAVAFGGEAVPAATAADWASNADAALKANQAQAATTGALAQGGMWAGLVTAALGALFIAKKLRLTSLLTMVPGAGPVLAPVADLLVNWAWDAGASKKAHEAERARLAVVDGAARALPFLQALASAHPDGKALEPLIVAARALEAPAKP